MRKDIFLSKITKSFGISKYKDNDVPWSITNACISNVYIDFLINHENEIRIAYSVSKEIKSGEALLCSNYQPTKKNFELTLCHYEHENCEIVIEENVKNAIEMFARKSFTFQIEFDGLMEVYTDERQSQNDALVKLRRISKLKKSSSVTNVSLRKSN